MIKVIIAVAFDTETGKHIIGNKDKLPWHIPNELKYFKKTTEGATLLMGERTFDGLPGMLPNREVLVFGKSKAAQVKSFDEAFELIAKFKDSTDTLWISGGKFVYEQFGHLADEWYVTYIHQDVKGDVSIELDNLLDRFAIWEGSSQLEYKRHMSDEDFHVDIIRKKALNA